VNEAIAQHQATDNTSKQPTEQDQEEAAQYILTIKDNEKILGEMAAVSLDKVFKDDVSANEQRLRVLSDAERMRLFHVLAQYLLGDRKCSSSPSEYIVQLLIQ